MEYIPRLKKKYLDEVKPKLIKKFGYSSPMETPKLVKICINQGVGKAVADKRLIESSLEEMTIIAGQKAVPTKAKRDISNFKVRKGMPIGARVTLRGDRMYEFFDRLTSVALPRTRDFKGIDQKGFDRKGNYTLGVKEQIIFAEINIDKVKDINGMDITFVTTAKTDEEAYALLKEMGVPFKEKEKNN